MIAGVVSYMLLCWGGFAGLVSLHHSVGLGGNCDCRCGILYAPMLVGGLQDWLVCITVSPKLYTYPTGKIHTQLPTNSLTQ